MAGPPTDSFRWIKLLLDRFSHKTTDNMGRASTWNNRATIPLRIPKVLASAGNYLFRGIDTFIFTPDKPSECFQVTLNDATGCNYLIEMVITRIPSTTTTAIAVTNSAEELNTELVVPIDAIGSNSRSDDSNSLVRPEQPITGEITASPVNDVLMESAESTEELVAIEELTNGNPTEVVADEELVQEENLDFALLTLALTDFSDQVYYCWHRLAATMQLPVWGCAIELDDIYRSSFGTMPGELFLNYLQHLIEQEASQKVARFGLVNIPGRQSFTVGTQEVCALTFWSDWHQQPVEVDDQPVTILLPESTVQAASQQETAPVTELKRLQTVLAQCPESSPQTHVVPAPTTIERLRLERQQHLQMIKEGEAKYQAVFGQNPKRDSPTSAQHSKTNSKPSESSFLTGFLGLFQKATG